MEKSKLEKICGLWKKQTKDGRSYLSGKIDEDYNCLVFKNTYKKEGDNQPDYNVFRSPSFKRESEQEVAVVKERVRAAEEIFSEDVL